MSFDLSTAKPVTDKSGFDLSTAKSVAATGEQETQASVGGRFLQGMRDPIDASAQLLTHMLPAGAVKAGNAVNNWIADKTGLVGRLPEGGLDQELKSQEDQYQAARKATGSTGIDLARIGGNLASPVNLAIASRVPSAVTTAGRLGTAAAAGGIYGATSSPVTEGDFATEKAKQVGLGAAMGPAAEVIGTGVSRLVQPQTREAVTKLLSEGITPTPGQILGGRWQTTEDKLTSVPILGDAIASARGKGLDELNTAAYKRVLDPIGGTVPKTVGRDAIADVRQQVSDAYDKLLPKVQFKADPQFGADLKTLQGMATNMPPEQAGRFEKILRDQVIGKMTPQGSMDGQTLKGIEGDLGTLAAGLSKDPTFDNRTLGAAITEVQAAIRSNLERANPEYADALKAANTSWANFKRVQNAAGKVGADEGKFTPSQLQNAVRTLDRSKDKRAFSEGDALMQDLSDPAKSVLASKYPDSGTAGRGAAGVVTGATAAGGASALPAIGIPGLSAGVLAILPYLPGGRQVAAALLAKRPDLAQPVAKKIRELAPAATPALIQSVKPGAFQQQN